MSNLRFHLQVQHLSWWFVCAILLGAFPTSQAECNETSTCDSTSTSPLNDEAIRCNPVCHADSLSCNGGELTFKHSISSTYVTTVRSEYTAMDCEAENFCSIQWLREGSISCPFNFKTGSTYGYQSLLDCNQTLELANTQKDAIGNYTCIASNSQGTIQRTYHLNVLDHPFEGPPAAISNENCNHREASLGENVTLFCEFCVGDKTQQTELQWYKMEGDREVALPALAPGGDGDRSGSTENVQYQESDKVYGKSCLEMNTGPASVGKFLIIFPVDQASFGSYVLRANYTKDGVIVGGNVSLALSEAQFITIEDTIAIVVALVALFVIIVTGTVLGYKYHLTAQLYWKNQYGKIEEQDGYQYDAFISYSDEDCGFALHLMAFLEEHHYQVWVRDIHSTPGETLIAEEVTSMKQSRRSILIVSADYLTSSHNQILTELAEEQTLKQESKIIIILYRDVSKEQLQTHARLATMVRVLPCITWKEDWEGDAEGGSGGIPEGGSGGIAQGGSGEIAHGGSGGIIHGGSGGIAHGGSGEIAHGGSGGIIHGGSGGMAQADNHMHPGKDDDKEILINGDDGIGMAVRQPRTNHGDGGAALLVPDKKEAERKRKLAKAKEKNEKKLLLRMPPKREEIHQNQENNVV